VDEEPKRSSKAVKSGFFGLRAIGRTKQPGTTPGREQRNPQRTGTGESREQGKMGIRQEAAFGLRIDACLREKMTEIGPLTVGER
jgi:hypothetical protein